MTPNRTLCDALRELRDITKILDEHNVDKSKSILSLLTEEIQVYGNRMEAALYDKKDLEYYRDELRELKREVKKLKAQKKDLEND